MISRGKRGTLLVLACACAVALPLAVRGSSCGHDFDFHLQSWLAVARHWRDGLFYPHWIEAANYGAGEPRLVFYPPFTWMLGAALGTLLPWPAAPVAFTLVVMAASGLSMAKLANDYLPPRPATLAACAYILNPYALFVAYERTAYGELAAAIWLPLIILFALRTANKTVILSGAKDLPGVPGPNSESRAFPRTQCVPLALTIAAIWLTNAPAAVMACYLLAAITLWRSLGQRSWRPILQSTAALLLGLGLAAVFLVPAAYERRWVDIARAIAPGMRIQDSFLFQHTGQSFHDQVLRAASWIFVTMTVTILALAWLAWRRKSARTLIPPIFVTAIVLLLLQSPWSAPLWNHAPELQFLQFPWRFSLVLSVAFAVAIGMAAAPHTLPTGKSHAARAILLAAAVASVSVGTWLFWQPCDDEDAVSAQLTLFHSGDGFEGTDEYTALGTDNSEIQQSLPPVRVLRDPQAETAKVADDTQANPAYQANPSDRVPAQIAIRRWQPEQKSLTITTPAPAYAVLRLMDYPAWRVADNGIPQPSREHREDGLMTIQIDAGPNRIEVRYAPTPDVLWGRALSAASLLVLLALVAAPKSRRPVEEPVG